MPRLLAAVLLLQALAQTRAQAIVQSTVTVWQSCGVPTTTIYPAIFSSFSSRPTTTATSTCSLSTLSGAPTATPTQTYQSGAPSCPSSDDINACSANGTSCTNDNGNQYQLSCGVGPSCGVVIPTISIDPIRRRAFTVSFGACLTTCDVTTGCIAALYRPNASPGQVCTLFAEAYNYVPIPGAQFGVRPVRTGNEPTPSPSSVSSTSSSSSSRSGNTNTATTTSSLPTFVYNPLPPRITTSSETSAASTTTSTSTTTTTLTSTSLSTTTAHLTSTSLSTTTANSATFVPSFTYAPSSPTGTAAPSGTAVLVPKRKRLQPRADKNRKRM